MKYTGAIVGIIVSLFVVIAVLLSVQSRQRAFSGLVEGKLAPCPETPNCICSEYPGTQGYVEPLSFDGIAAEAWGRAVDAVRASGGKVVREEDSYLAATYTSLVFRFVDELELRLDRKGKRIHIRSASRVGYSDLGVNRKRAETFRRFFAERSTP